MIISHKHKFIFLRTRKTAGLSMEVALSKICGPDDIVTKVDPKFEGMKKKLGYPTRQNFQIPTMKHDKKHILKILLKRAKRGEYYNHMTAKEVKRFTSSSVWNNYYKFCFERNPYDKVISLYYWQLPAKRPKTIQAFIESGAVDRIIRGYDLYSINSKPVVDNVYKYEEIEEALKDLTNRFNLSEPLELPKRKIHSNTRTDKRHYREVLNEKEIELINDIFSREIDYLDYKY